MKKTKESLGITLIVLVIAVIVLLILIMVLVSEIDRGIFEHTNKYVTQMEKATSEGKNIENQIVEEYKEFL